MTDREKQFLHDELDRFIKQMETIGHERDITFVAYDGRGDSYTYEGDGVIRMRFRNGVEDSFDDHSFYKTISNYIVKKKY